MMQATLYYFLLPFVYFVSILPFRLLYIMSDFVYIILYKILKYRKTEVITNLKNSFPEKSETEILALCSEYYKYLCDLILESFKKITMSADKTLKHCKFHNPEVVDQFFDKNTSVILILGHFGNWEWAGSSFSLSCKHQLHVIYKPLSNPYFENLMTQTRTLFGTKLIKMQNTLKDILTYKDTRAAFAFVADQTPAPHTAYWTSFLNQDTPFFTGAEKLAKKYSFPVLFINITRPKRGYYEIFPEVITAKPKENLENEIIQKYALRLEEEIIKSPTIWLWSHKRWKYKRDL